MHSKKLLRINQWKRSQQKTLLKWLSLSWRITCLSLITKCFSKYQELSPPKTFIYVDRVDQCFLEKQKQPFLCLIYIVFFLFFVFLFIWTHGKEELKKFMEKFDNFTTNLRFTYKSIEKEISILDPLVTLSERKGIFTTTYGFI